MAAVARELQRRELDFEAAGPAVAPTLSTGKPPSASEPARLIASLAAERLPRLPRSTSWAAPLKGEEAKERLLVLGASSELLLYTKGSCRSGRSNASESTRTARELGLEAAPAEDEAEAALDARQRPRLSRAKLTMVALLNLVDCINMNLLTPYAAEMVSNLVNKPVNSAEVLEKVGLLVGVYNISEMIFSPTWGRLSDRWGRRPIILLSVGGAALIPIVFGLSGSFAMAMAVRAFNGVLCGSIGILKTYVAELVEKDKEARAFSVITTCYSVGMILGPAIGGQLSSPGRWSEAASRFFDLGPLSIFKREPFLLPNLVFSMFACTVWVLAYFFLEESLPRSERIRLQKLAAIAKAQRQAEEAAAAAEEGGEGRRQARGRRLWEAAKRQLPLLNYPSRLLRAIAAYALAVGYVIATVQNIMLLYQIPVEDHGFGLGPKMLGILQNCAALGLLVTQLVLYPKLVRLKGYRWCVITGLSAVLLVTLPMPLYGLMADPAEFKGVRLVPLVIMMVVQQAAFGFCTPTTMVWINRFADGHDRGEVNGWSNAIAALCRAVAPVLVGSLQSLGASSGLRAGRYFALYIISMMAVGISLLLLPVLPEGAGLPAKPAEEKSKESEDHDSSDESETASRGETAAPEKASPQCLRQSWQEEERGPAASEAAMTPRRSGLQASV